MPELGNRRSPIDASRALPGNRVPGRLYDPPALRSLAQAGEVAQESLEAGVVSAADVGSVVQAYSDRLLLYGEGEIVLPPVSVASTYTVAAGVSVVLGDATSAAFDVTLPNPALNNGRQITVKKTDASANAVTVDGDTANIDGSTTYALPAQNNYVTVLCDGTNWQVIAAG